MYIESKVNHDKVMQKKVTVIIIYFLCLVKIKTYKIPNEKKRK